MHRFKSLKPSLLTTACSAAVLSMGTLATGAVIVTDPGTNTLRNNGTQNYNGSLGYVFTVNTADDIQVTHLGVYDAPGNAAFPSGGDESSAVGDGLEISSKVVIYKVASVTGASTPYSYTSGGAVANAAATVGAGTAGTLLDGYRYVLLPEAVVLEAGETYQIVMESRDGGNGFLNYQGGTDPTINGDFYIYPTVVHGSRTADHPNFATGGTGNGRTGDPYIGPNFQYTVIPEPAALSLLGLGGLMLIRRRR